MSKITNDCLTRSGTGCSYYMATVGVNKRLRHFYLLCEATEQCDLILLLTGL